MELKEHFGQAVRLYQAHRGPDDYNELQATENLFFFHNRLSIIDPSRAKQPMEDEEGIITYNGEVYNFRELKDSSVTYRYDSDTEVLLKGLNTYSTSFLSLTHSMFGFGYYNKKSRTLTVGRDRLGIKQVYYIETDEVFAFASTLSPLVLLSKKRLNYRALWQYYLNRAFKAPETIFDDIKELENGSYLQFDTNNSGSKTSTQLHDQLKPTCHYAQNGDLGIGCGPSRARTAKWWHRAKLDESQKTVEKNIETVDSLLQEAVRYRMIADVPVGAYLSGGVDSSLIVAMASKFHPDLHTFTVAMKDKRYDESRYAKNICRQYGLHYHEIVVGAEDFLDSIDGWIAMQDDIVSDPSAIMLYRISLLARERGFKVMLSGEGSDELFGGYLSYKRFAQSQMLHKYLKIARPASKIITKLLGRDSKRFHFIKYTLNSPAFFGTALIIEPDLLRDLLCNEDYVIPVASTLKEALDLDIRDRLPNDILTRVDRATMGASIEARVPFLSHKLVDFAASLNESQIIAGGEGKFLVKKVAERYLPHENIYRKKVGFDLPIDHWIRNELKPLVQELIRTSEQRDFVNINTIQVLFEGHCAGKINAASKIWAFVSLELSYRYLSGLHFD